MKFTALRSMFFLFSLHNAFSFQSMLFVSGQWFLSILSPLLFLQTLPLYSSRIIALMGTSRGKFHNLFGSMLFLSSLLFSLFSSPLLSTFPSSSLPSPPVCPLPPPFPKHRLKMQ